MKDVITSSGFCRGCGKQFNFLEDGLCVVCGHGDAPGVVWGRGGHPPMKNREDYKRRRRESTRKWREKCRNMMQPARTATKDS